MFCQQGRRWVRQSAITKLPPSCFRNILLEHNFAHFITRAWACQNQNSLRSISIIYLSIIYKSTWPLFVCWCGFSGDTKDISSLLLFRQVVNTEAASNSVERWRHEPGNKYKPTATVHCTTGSIQGRGKCQNHTEQRKMGKNRSMSCLRLPLVYWVDWCAPRTRALISIYLKAASLLMTNCVSARNLTKQKVTWMEQNRK